MSTRTAILITMGVIALALIIRRYFVGHQVPEGQLQLEYLTSESIDSLRNNFNHDSKAIRVILLLSPT